MGKREEAARAVQKVFSDFGLDSPELDSFEALMLVNAVIACIREPDEKMLASGVSALIDAGLDGSNGVGHSDVIACLQAVLDSME